MSLWVGEAFAADLHRIFPRLKILSASANKMLGLLGQSPQPLPASGFQLNQQSYSFRNSAVLLISQSGSTFATLGCANLLRAFTPHLFSLSSHWDTQLARVVRAAQLPKLTRWSISFSSYTFVTHTAHSSAEPCSLTVAATHQLLTQLLIALMHYAQHKAAADCKSSSEAAQDAMKTSTACRCGGANFYAEDVEELSRLNSASIEAIGVIVGEPRRPTATSTALHAQGRRWALYILESPFSWICSALYILATVIAHKTPLSAIVNALAPSGTPAQCDAAPHLWVQSLTGLVDALIYIFLPIWTTWLVRLALGIPCMHRIAGRTLLIGDAPWVSQSLDNFVSKLFSLSYSIASIDVKSANPLDHLLHRHTHRITRGSLLAFGRADGRLNSLASSEKAVELAVGQACAIRNLGEKAESFTLGHNPYKFALSASAVHLPTLRPRFLCEELAARRQRTSFHETWGRSVRALMSQQAAMRMATLPNSQAPSADNSAHAGASVRPAAGSATLDDATPKSMRSFLTPRDTSLTGPRPNTQKGALPSSPEHPQILGSGAMGSMTSAEDLTSTGSSMSNSPRPTNRSMESADFVRECEGDSTSGAPSDLRTDIPITHLDGLRSSGQSSAGGRFAPYLGAWLKRKAPFATEGSCGAQMDHQELLQNLHESRYAQLQRFVAFCVMFHAMGARVRNFWPAISFGFLGYDMARSQSQLRVASTASPISGCNVRDQMRELARKSRTDWAANVIAQAFRHLHLNHVLKRMIEESDANGPATGEVAANGALVSGQRTAGTLPARPAMAGESSMLRSLLLQKQRSAGAL